LNNYVETVLHGTDPGRSDTDGDGLSDKTEVAGGTNPLFNDRSTVQLVTNSPQTFGLYDESMIRQLYLGDIVIGREAGVFRLTLQPEGTSTIAPGKWTPLGAPVEWTLPVPDSNTFFYRIRTTK
jgi:hypothetical protein